MKSAAFEIQIPRPCTVSESRFRPHDTGDWCLSCKKNVVDFTEMSDAEIIRFFQDKPLDAQICGTMRNDQLNKPFRSIPVSQPASGWWPVVLGSFLTVLSVGKAAGQATDPMTWQPVPTETPSMFDQMPTRSEVKPVATKKGEEVKEKTRTGYRIITVRLKLKGWKPAIIQEVFCQETSETVTVSEKGYFKLTIPDSVSDCTYSLFLKRGRNLQKYRARIKGRKFILRVVEGKSRYKIKVMPLKEVRHRIGFVFRKFENKPSLWNRLATFFNPASWIKNVNT
ncbi:MAG TPA: hypothetical protein PK509_08005 [Catalimonadaceae bacterium]|nr:hypothetical protein [Catalimonadaceae bacterium]